MDKDKPEPLIYYAWWRAAYRSIFADELGDLFSEYVRANRKPDAGVFRSVLSEKEAWCDDITTAERESCRAKLAESLSDALVYLSERYGDRMDRWTWGEAHKVRFTNKVLTRVPLIRNFSDFEASTDGGMFTINRGRTSLESEESPFAHVAGSGYRAIYDLADRDESLFMIATGQSGHFLSSFYDNFVERWRQVEYVKIRGTKEDLAKTAEGKLVLIPE